ncbi:uncharacterized protein DUF4230 [Larkinella arboricola]|uniref:Uncharacterized protein DUF4230 n=1 Tax=Larkinella arboricola TaxID=643671 RepID=A0A327WWN1_LARAB|nr:DUF4230 domain-containing protein [Larkinella arboricola]RAJ97559.1 uncharacterized protein DUF4230 [Larkinella arboricola]
MTRFINSLLRFFLVLLLVVGLVVLWEQLRGWSVFSGLTKKEASVQTVVLQEVTELGKLELVKYRFKDIVEHQLIREWLPNPKAVLIVEGEAVGCLDLTKITSEDITTQGDSLIVHLPDPELCSYKIDHRNSRVFNTEYTFFEEAQLVSEAYRRAETQIRRAALNSGILEQTRQNADKILKPMLERISGKKVFLTTRLKATLQPLR